MWLYIAVGLGLCAALVCSACLWYFRIRNRRKSKKAISKEAQLELGKQTQTAERVVSTTLQLASIVDESRSESDQLYGPPSQLQQTVMTPMTPSGTSGQNSNGENSHEGDGAAEGDHEADDAELEKLYDEAQPTRSGIPANHSTS